MLDFIFGINGLRVPYVVEKDTRYVIAAVEIKA